MNLERIKHNTVSVKLPKRGGWTRWALETTKYKKSDDARFY